MTKVTEHPAATFIYSLIQLVLSFHKLTESYSALVLMLGMQMLRKP